MSKRLRGGSSQTKEAKYKSKRDGIHTRKLKVKRGIKRISGFKKPELYDVTDTGQIIKKEHTNGND